VVDFVLSAAEEVVREAVGAGVVEGVVDASEFEFTSGDFGRVVPFPAFPALKNGDGVLPTIGGVPVREGDGLGRFIDGLSHDEKKSSSGSSVVMVGPPSSMTTESGYLQCSFVRRWKTGNSQKGLICTFWHPLQLVS